MAHAGIRTIVLVSTLSLSACSSGGGPTPPSPSEKPSTSSDPTTETPWTDTETPVPAPSPPTPSTPPPDPGGGSADLAIMVKPSDSEPAIHYTLTCKGGAPTDESQHPSAAKACQALKNNFAVLIPQPRNKDVVCTQQYGGPQTATVTGVVGGIPVDTSFTLQDGCEISQWNAAASILGPVT